MVGSSRPESQLTGFAEGQAIRALLVPVKSFRTAKLRLAPVLDAPQRAELARSLAAGVLQAGAGLERYVVCDDDEVASWAASRGAHVIWAPGLGLSGAVGFGVASLAAAGFALAVIAHSDLPKPEGVATIGEPHRVSLVPDLRSDGTNVAVVPTTAGFRFFYGAGSFERHRDEAGRLGLACEVIRHPGLAADVDWPGDLAHVAPAQLARARAASATP
ncbi:MAG: CofC family guanylyltransferase [Acidimicrobiales bacterium]